MHTAQRADLRGGDRQVNLEIANSVLAGGLVRLEIRTFNNVAGMTTKCEVPYGGSAVRNMAIPDCKQ